MAKTLTNLRGQVRQYLDEAVTADWTQTEVDREINHYYMSLYTAVCEVFESYYSTTENDDTEENVQEYSLPSDFWKIQRVEINYDVDNANSTAKRALPISIDDVKRDLGNTNIGVAVHRAPAYYLRGDYIGFLPIPDEDGTDAIKLWYVSIPDELSVASDTISIPFPDRYGGLISLGAAGTLLRKGQQEETAAARYLLEFEAGVLKMKQELEDRKADDVKGVTDTVGLDLDFSHTL